MKIAALIVFLVINCMFMGRATFYSVVYAFSPRPLRSVDYRNKLKANMEAFLIATVSVVVLFIVLSS